VLVTGREDRDDTPYPAAEVRSLVGSRIPTVFAGAMYKEKAAIAAGYPVDIWIDDKPGFISPDAVDLGFDLLRQFYALLGERGMLSGDAGKTDLGPLFAELFERGFIRPQVAGFPPQDSAYVGIRPDEVQRWMAESYHREYHSPDVRWGECEDHPCVEVRKALINRRGARHD